MKITSVETLHADAGWRVFSYVKISTDEGLVGWSEFNESYGTKGTSTLISKFGQLIHGKDPMSIERHVARFLAVARAVPGGIVQHAIGAVENALYDIKGKALGVPVYQLIGGAVRDKIPLYWSHIGSYRVSHADLLGTPPVKTLDDIVALGREVRDQGYSALKTKIIRFDNGKPEKYAPGFGFAEDFQPELNPDPRVFAAIVDTLEAYRQGAGPNVAVMLDINSHFRLEGVLELVRNLNKLKLGWLELDCWNPEGLAKIREHADMPIACCEALFGRRQYKPFFDHCAVDVALVDVAWNGLGECMKIASLADVYDINIAPHNFFSPLATFMSANYSAAIPNLRMMEIDVDDVSWAHDFVTTQPEIENGMMKISTKPGWGTEVNEEAVRAHPPLPGRKLSGALAF